MTRILRKRPRLNRSLGGNVLIALFLAVLGLFMALPMIYAVCSSLKPLDELWIFPPRFLVRHPTLKNFSDLFTLMAQSWVPFLRYVFNTVLVSVLGTAGHVLIASLAAYALSKHDFYGRSFLFKLVELSLMFSAAVTAIPSYLIMTRLHMINTYWSLILPAFSGSLGLFLMKQFMDSMIPGTVLESARLDGAGEWRIFRAIVMPMVKPAWLTLIVFSFQGLWNIGTTTYIYSEKLKTLNYAISQILAGGIARAGAGAAAAVMMMVVPVLVFVVTQSSVIETMSTSGMKE